MAAVPVSVNENVPSLAKTLLVNSVQDATGIDRSVEAQSRKGLPDGPVPLRDTFPFAKCAIPVSCGVSTIRKIVPPPPVPPFAVVP